MIRLSRTLLFICGLALAKAAWGSLPAIVVAPGIEVVRAEFGTFAAPGSDGPAFTATDVVPNRENQRYGWIVLLKTNKYRIRWHEELTLPTPPESWREGQERGLRAISPDRRSAVTERETTPDQGMIYNAWAVEPGDPSGRYLIRLMIEGIKELRFEFELK